MGALAYLIAWLVGLVGLTAAPEGAYRDPILPVPSPTPVVEAPADITVTTGLVVEFARGYADAGGPPELIDHLVYNVIPCESGWQVEPPYSGFLGLAQFHPDTWARAGGGDWRDPYQQGANVATWIRLIGVDAAGTAAGWPHCWWAG